MPVERVTQEFKDISMTFKVNPLNQDLIALKNVNAIARSLKNIVFTGRGEKFFDPEFGSRVSESLFENLDEVAALAIKDEIEYHERYLKRSKDLLEELISTSVNIFTPPFGYFKSSYLPLVEKAG